MGFSKTKNPNQTVYQSFNTAPLRGFLGWIIGWRRGAPRKKVSKIKKIWKIKIQNINSQ